MEESVNVTESKKDTVLGLTAITSCTCATFASALAWSMYAFVPTRARTYIMPLAGGTNLQVAPVPLHDTVVVVPVVSIHNHCRTETARLSDDDAVNVTVSPS